VFSVTQASVKQAALFMVFQVFQMAVYFIALSGELQRLSAIRSLMKGLALGLMIQAGYVISQKVGGMVQAPGTTEHQNILGHHGRTRRDTAFCRRARGRAKQACLWRPVSPP
jgi:hypothetical protein